MTRREGLALAAAGLGGCAGGTHGAAPTPRAASAPLVDPEALYRDVVTYDGFGWHRTGTPGDARTLAWMEEHLTGAGYTTQRLPFTFDHYAPRRADLTFGTTETLGGDAQWPVTYTGPEGVEAPLVLYNRYAADQDLAGRIVVAPLPHMRQSSLMDPRVLTHVRRIAKAGAAGAVLVTMGPSQTRIAMNAPTRHPDIALPLMTAAPNEAGAALRAAAEGAPGRLVIDGEGPEPREAFNLVGERGRGARWIIVSTPMSGWYTCAAERGPGIAVFRAMAEYLPAIAPGHRLLLVATSGHELENKGAEHLLATAMPPPAETDLWLHLGAGLAAKDILELDFQPILRPDADTQRILMGSDSLIPILSKRFRDLPGLATVVPARIEFAAGELLSILKAGYTRVYGGFGSHPYHHSPEDRPDKTSPELLGALGEAMLSSMRDIVRTL